MIRILLILSCALLLQLSSIGQCLKPGPQVLSFFSAIDDTDQPYGIYVPPGYTPVKKYPLVVMLHGAGSNHRLALRRVFGKSNIDGENDVEASRYFPEWKDRDFIVVSTYARGTVGYQGIPEKDVWDMIADVKSKFSIDENRQYLTGLSMGGGGTMWIGLTRPDFWAAIAPVCPAVPSGTEVFTNNAFNIPVHIHQGGADPVVPTKGVKEWANNLEEAGATVEYTEYPGVSHDSWVNAYQDGQVFDWLGQFTRNPNPDRVKFSTDRYQYSSAYWVTLDVLEPGATASIDAGFNGRNNLSIQTEHLQAFTLNLKRHPNLKKSKKLKIKIDGQAMDTKNEDVLHFSYSGRVWRINKGEQPSISKKSGAEGPMTAAIADRHIYVYGTNDNASKEEIETRKQQAEKAANWAFYRGEFLGRIKIYPRVLSDKEIRPADLESSNLILFGTTKTNSIIEKYKTNLPLELKYQSEDFGMAYIFPVGERYVVINSGLSIFDAPDSDKVIDGLSRYASPPIVLALGKFKDFVLYDKEKILVDGYFDNDWQLSEPAKKQLKESGLVEFNR